MLLFPTLFWERKEQKKKLYSFWTSFILNAGVWFLNPKIGEDTNLVQKFLSFGKDRNLAYMIGKPSLFSNDYYLSDYGDSSCYILSGNENVCWVNYNTCMDSSYLILVVLLSLFSGCAIGRRRSMAEKGGLLTDWLHD